MLLRQSTAFIDDEGMAEALRLIVAHRLQETECIGISKCAMLLEAFAVIAALHIMEAARIAAVVPGKNAAQAVDLDAERIAAAFRENLETLLIRLISPNMLADHRHGRALVAGDGNLRGDGAAVGAVQPAIGPPMEAAGARVR